MEYERIHKMQNGIISPSKLRIKLMGPHNGRRKDTCSPRTSPSKAEETDVALNGLLTASSGESDDGGNPSLASCAVHPDNVDYDSNASSSSFEFHKEKAGQAQVPLTRSLSRPMSSKWNDAEKWIMSKSIPQKQHAKKLANRMSRNSEEFRLPLPPLAPEAMEEEAGEVVGVRSVCMRDTGTEMTPATSVEPSRSATPAGAGTPLRSPAESIPTTPRRAAEPPGSVCCPKMSEEEQKQKTRREIVALGKQLGKLNIAAWASKEEDDVNPNPSHPEETTSAADSERIEREKLAARWEEAEKSKYAARHKREEMKILAWEAQQKAVLEAELRKIEAQVEQLHAQAQAKMVKKISRARHRSEEKRAAAEARRKRDEDEAAAKAEIIRLTGRIPSSRIYSCCGLR